MSPTVTVFSKLIVASKLLPASIFRKRIMVKKCIVKFNDVERTEGFELTDSEKISGDITKYTRYFATVGLQVRHAL